MKKLIVSIAAFSAALSLPLPVLAAGNFSYTLQNGDAVVTNNRDGASVTFRDVYRVVERDGELSLYFLQKVFYEPEANYLAIYVNESDLGGPTGDFMLYRADPDTGELLVPTGEIISYPELLERDLYHQWDGYYRETGWKMLPPESGSMIPATYNMPEDLLWFSFSNEVIASNSWPKDGTGGVTVYIAENPDSMLLAWTTGILSTEDGFWYHYSNGKWRFKGKKGYYNKGRFLSEWQKIDGSWYYFEPYMPHYSTMQKGWIKFQNRWYYLGGDGRMRTGWLENGGEWYYLNVSGAMQTGWKEIGGKWYYFDSSGKMLTSRVIDGCQLDENGVWVQ